MPRWLHTAAVAVGAVASLAGQRFNITNYFENAYLQITHVISVFLVIIVDAARRLFWISNLSSPSLTLSHLSVFIPLNSVFTSPSSPISRFPILREGGLFFIFRLFKSILYFVNSPLSHLSVFTALSPLRLRPSLTSVFTLLSPLRLHPSLTSVFTPLSLLRLRPSLTSPSSLLSHLSGFTALSPFREEGTACKNTSRWHLHIFAATTVSCVGPSRKIYKWTFLLLLPPLLLLPLPPYFITAGTDILKAIA